MITTKRKRTIARRGILWTVGVAVGLLCTGPLFAQGSPLSGTPAPMILTPNNSTPVIGDQVTFDVGVNLSGVTGPNCNSANAAVVLGSYTVRLDYDSSILNLASTSPGSTAPYSGIAPTTGPPDPDGSGYVIINAVQASTNSPTGLVMFARVTFDTVGLGPVNVTATTESMSSALQCSGAFGPTSISAIPDSESITVVNSPPPPGTPFLIAPANNSTGLANPVNISWTAAANADFYIVEIGLLGEPLEFAGTNTGTNGVFDDLDEGRTYRWRVVAATDEGGRTSSSTWSFTMFGTACNELLAPVISLPTEVDSGMSYTLSWDAVAGANGYRVEESTTSDFAVVNLSSVSGDVTELTFVKNVNQDLTFYYRVAALNTVEPCDVSSPFSSVLPITIIADRVRTATVPVVGKLVGAFESNFGTLLQIHNATDIIITGNLKFYRQDGLGASAADVESPYMLRPGETNTVDDLLDHIGETGIGSLDIEGDPNMPLPVAIARIFNDLGEGAGTNGAVVPTVDETDRLVLNDTALLIAPSDLVAARFNVGVRTFGAGATINFTVNNNSGQLVTSFTRSYPSDFFNQWAANDFIGTTLGEDDTIYLTIVDGSAIVYGTWTDNVTNDPAVQVATELE